MSTDTLTKDKIEIELNHPWNVIFHNDNVTTFDLVIYILMQVFDKPLREAEGIAMYVHTKGKYIVASYPYEIAEQKVAEGIAIARSNGAPLVITFEESK